MTIEIKQLENEIRNRLAQEHNWKAQEKNWEAQKTHWKWIGTIGVLAVILKFVADVYIATLPPAP